MRKICLFLILFLIPFAVKANESDLTEHSKSAIMVEYSTGEILYKKNINQRMAPASMTKIMSLILIMESIETGRLNWNDIVVASANASSMGGSQIYLETNEMMSVMDLVKGICIASGNDATVALAEKIAGTEAAFVKLMNNKARELGLKDTNFVNSTGLDAEGHYSTVYDMAIMARELIKYEKILEFSSIYEDYLRKNTENSFWLVNTNKLVRYYSYIDGLKTGYTGDAGYCLTATGKKNGMRIITVIMNADTSQNRNNDTISMMNYGFNLYSLDMIVNKKDVLGNVKVSLGEYDSVSFSVKDSVTVLNNNQNNKRNITYDIKTNNVIAPVKVGDKVGELSVYEDGEFKYLVDLIAVDDVGRTNIFKMFLRNMRDIFSIIF